MEYTMERGRGRFNDERGMQRFNSQPETVKPVLSSTYGTRRYSQKLDLVGPTLLQVHTNTVVLRVPRF